MTPLKQHLIRRIGIEGPLSIADYMALCLFHPEHGYYVGEQPFGADGDFITAPDVSQMFGELTAAWLVQAWQAIGSPPSFNLCEIGPGRGTWMRDITSTLSKLAPAMLDDSQILMVEKSARLADAQAQVLGSLTDRIDWIENIAELKGAPTLFIANELFDALPARQFVKTGHGWLERMVGLDDSNELAMAIGSASIDNSLLPLDAATAPDGTVFEYAPAREALCQQMAEHIQAHRGFALIFDYGHAHSAVGDTLQAVRRHKYEQIFAHPGQADLTSHVDFQALQIAAAAGGAKASDIVTQAEFLLGLGLLERAGALGADKDDKIRQKITQDVNRLAGSGHDQMGQLFKVMCLSDTPTIPPAPFTPAKVQETDG